tara:strand:- start:258 stop:551 length:294 start_codon:yes stop_codon:yes gene_type:complete
MEFTIEGKRTTTIVTTCVFTELVTGEIDITKKEVMRATECLAKEDGDTTAWYNYVPEAIASGAAYKEIEIETEVLNEDYSETQNEDWQQHDFMADRY